MLSKLLEIAKEQKASDLHFSASAKPKIRIDGSLVNIEDSEILHPDEIKDVAYSILTKENKDALDLNGDVDFACDFDNSRLRVNIYKEQQGLSIAIRILPKEIPTLVDLSMPNIIKEIASLKRGLVLITGATGSGKSTTLAAILDYINTTRKEHIITIEDPIEYIHTHKNCIVNQREVGRDVTSLERALRSSLRQDPDIIFLGEMRDMKTTQTALTAAETGHLVFSTLHTNGAADSINRIIDMFPHGAREQIKTQLASTLKGVITQRLIKKDNSIGRVAALEVMIVNQAIKNLIREDKTHHINQTIQTHMNIGMQCIDHRLAQLHKKKIISYDDAIAHCTDINVFKQFL